MTRVEVVVYGAADCHLCDEAKALLRPAAERLGFDLHEVDITGDEQLEAAYRSDIPVVEIDGRRSFKYRIPLEELERRLQRARERRAAAAQGEGAGSGL